MRLVFGIVWLCAAGVCFALGLDIYLGPDDYSFAWPFILIEMLLVVVCLALAASYLLPEPLTKGDR